ncbi:MAG: 1-deoxy-D-xylulose-5-phosphate synthase, partial [Muribaculaceae bacterium]|nr:1-deoxy-D-xylulose-5-phosphate synthase [Muribaculaceae bacterium]
RNVVAVIGDSSISGGLAFEGLNNVANTPNNLLIILNDNEMSIDHNVGALTKYLSKINTSKRYNRLRYKGYKLLRKIGLIDDRHRGPIIRFNNSLKSLFSHQQNMFEGLNIRYFGPIDGNDVEKVVRVLQDIKDLDGPKLLHLRTIKGKGYAPAEQNPAVWHAPGKFDPESGTIQKSDSSAPKWQDVFGNTLVELAKTNPKIIGITAAMSSGTSISSLQSVMPKRVFDVGISEGHAVTFAGGLAKEGMHPFVAIYSAFLQRAYDHIIHDVAIQHLPVTFCIDRAGLVGEDGPTHHGALDLAYLRTIPGMAIASPSDAETLRDLMFTASTYPGPMAIRYPRGTAIQANGNWATPLKNIEMGRGRKLESGSDVTFLTIGPISTNVSKAIARLKEEGIKAAHYDMIFLRPLDDIILKEVADSGSPIITVEDGITDGGLGSAVSEWLNDNGYKRMSVTRLGLPTGSFVTHGTVAQLQSLCGLDAESIYRTTLQAINHRQNKTQE